MILTTLSGLSLILPFITSILTYTSTDKTLKKLSVFIFIFVPIEVYAFYLNFTGQYNIHMFHLFTWFEGIFYALIFYDILKGNKRKIVPYLFSIFIILSVISAILWEPINNYTFNSIQRTVGGIITLLYVLGYFAQIFSEAKIQKIETDTYFPLCASLLIYTAGTLFLFILAGQFLTEKNFVYYDLHSVLNILLNIGITITLWMGTRKSN